MVNKTEQSSAAMSFVDSMFSLHGKIVLVTGAAHGIGYAIASGLLRAKATVVLVDVDSQRLLSVTQSLRDEGLDAHSVSCDLRQPDQIESLASQIQRQFVRVDVLVNNAGITIGHDMLQYPLEDWEETMRVNLRAGMCQ
jgi:gluconate 5-dehydrogenase